jgi:hypothetical protein
LEELDVSLRQLHDVIARVLGPPRGTARGVERQALSSTDLNPASDGELVTSSSRREKSVEPEALSYQGRRL